MLDTYKKISKSITTPTYDGYGNMTIQTNSISTYDSNTNAELTTETSTTNNIYNLVDTSNWWIDKLATTSVSKSVTDLRNKSSSQTIPFSNAPIHNTHSKFIWQTGTKRQLDCQYTSSTAVNASNCDAININSIDISQNKFNYDDYGNIDQVIHLFFPKVIFNSGVDSRSILVGKVIPL